MAVLQEVSRQYGKLRLYIDGEWVEPRTGTYFETTNPALDYRTPYEELVQHGPSEVATLVGRIEHGVYS